MISPTVISGVPVRPAALVANVAVAALPVHDPEEPETLPVTSPVRSPAKLDAVNTFVEGLYTRSVSTLTSSLPELDQRMQHSVKH